MRFPARFVTENLVWSTEGTTWAVWRLEPVSYPYAAAAEKLRVLHQIRAALMALPTEAMLLSVCRRIDPHSVVSRMIHGVDLDRYPRWRDHAAATLTQLDHTEIYDRYFYLAAALPDENWKQNLRASWSNAANGLWSQFGVPARPPTRQDLDRRRRQAAQLENQLRTGITLRAATPQELRWLYLRAPYRGLTEPDLDESWTPDQVSFGAGPTAGIDGTSLVQVVDAVFNEGGTGEDPDRGRHRRYTRVDTELGSSYQTFLVMASMPQAWVYPGGAGEWFVAADQAPFPVDWCARIISIPNSDAQLRARRQARQLQAQVAEFDGEPSGVPGSLIQALDSVDDERDELAASPATPELKVATIFSLASDTLVDLEDQAAQLRSMFEAWEYALPRPTGGQTALFRAMLPGASTPQVARAYWQYVLPRDLASGMPIGGTRIGDPSGTVLGYTLDGGTNQPVLFDGSYGPSINRSGSLAAIGGLGAGKSWALKLLAHAEIGRGGRVVALDRTPMGEYVRFASVVPGTTQTVRLDAGAEVCLDPMAVFQGPDRIRYATGFLTLLTGADPTDLHGATLAEAVRVVAQRPDGRLRDVIDALSALGDTWPEANDLARKVANFARSDLGDLAFGTGAPLALDADYIVLWTPALSLPDREQLINEYLARQLLPEQVLSQALLYLVAAIARMVAFNDRRYAAALFDEAWSVTASPQGKALVLEGVRDGRKHNAAIWLGSQHPDDIDPQIGELLGSRFVFRQARGAATKALAMLGMDPDPEWEELLETGLDPGHCLYRDVRDRIGRIEVTTPATRDLTDAFNTNPSAGGAGAHDDEFHTTPRSRRAAVTTQ
jgi:hypothetical protein